MCRNGDNAETHSLGGAQFEANLQVTTIACEHLSMDEYPSPEDRLGEHNLTPVWGWRQIQKAYKYLKK